MPAYKHTHNQARGDDVGQEQGLPVLFRNPR